MGAELKKCLAGDTAAKEAPPPAAMDEWDEVIDDELDEVIDSLLWKEDDNDNDSEVGPDSKSFLKNFKDLDVAFRKEAAADDERLLSD